MYSSMNLHNWFAGCIGPLLAGLEGVRVSGHPFSASYFDASDGIIGNDITVRGESRIKL